MVGRNKNIILTTIKHLSVMTRRIMANARNITVPTITVRMRKEMHYQVSFASFLEIEDLELIIQLFTKKSFLT